MSEQVTLNVRSLQNDGAFAMGFGIFTLSLCSLFILATGLGIWTLIFSILGILLIQGGWKQYRMGVKLEDKILSKHKDLA